MVKPQAAQVTGLLALFGGAAGLARLGDVNPSGPLHGDARLRERRAQQHRRVKCLVGGDAPHEQGGMPLRDAAGDQDLHLAGAGDQTDDQAAAAFAPGGGPVLHHHRVGLWPDADGGDGALALTGTDAHLDGRPADPQGRTLVGTTVPYTFTEEQRRYEAKGTYSLTPKHRFQVNYNHHDRSQVNYSFNQNLTMDQRSLGTRTLPERLYAGTYTATLSSKFFVEAMVSKRTLEFRGAGAKSTDLIEGTLLIDNSRGGARWWSDTFCGVCTPESRNAEEVFVKSTYFLSTPRFGSHNLVFGYDTFNDIRQADNHQSGSDYRKIGRAHV